jgi:hypothetical protein
MLGVATPPVAHPIGSAVAVTAVRHSICAGACVQIPCHWLLIIDWLCLS